MTLFGAPPLPLDDGWRFHEGDDPAAKFADYNDSSWQQVSLPHDWSNQQPSGAPEGATPYVQGIPNGSDVGYARGGFGWYRKVLDPDIVSNGSRVELVLNGAQQECDVWVNGKHAGFLAHSYVPVKFDITELLLPKAARQVVAIRVWNPGQNSRWYSGSGLFRGVSIRTHAPFHITTWGTRFDTVWIKGSEASVHVRVQLENQDDQEAFGSLELALTGPDGRTHVHPLGEVHIQPHAEETNHAWVWLKDISAWSPEMPNMYRAEIRIRRGSSVVDSYESRFGLRTIVLSAERGLELNGVPIKLRGGNVHHDNGLLGSCTFPTSERRRVALLKNLGFNALRCAHNPPSESFLDACDDLGILVIDEFSDCWQLPKMPNGYQRYFDSHAQAALKTMIARDFNHPSVIFWSIGNEIPERFTPTGVEVAKRLSSLVRSEDPRRPVTASLNLVWEDPSKGDVWELNDAACQTLDVAGYNYRWNKFEGDHVRFPQRVMYTAESYPLEALENWIQVEAHPYVLGDFVWSAIDYLGESGIGHAKYVDRDTPESIGQDASHLPWPVRISHCGDLDITGVRTPQSYYRDVVWHRSSLEILVHEPVPDGKREQVGSWGWPAERPDWNWEEARGKPLGVTIYASGGAVRLTLNGRVVGESEVKGLKAKFDVVWEPGVLKAERIEGDRVLATKLLESCGKAERITATAESETLEASTSSVIYVPVTVTDKQGKVVTTYAGTLSLQVTGPATVAAWGSGNPAQIEPPQKAIAQAYQGRALLILRSTGNTGTVKITVGGDRLDACTITIPVVR